MARVVEERWVCDAESKRILDEYAAKIEEEKARRAEEEERQAKKKEEEERKRRASYRANMSYDKLLLKYLQLKDFLCDCYPEVWKEFMDETETKMS
jgi:hypothetical protein